MGRNDVKSESSLDRLKNLSKLGNVDRQLEEAHQLCTHGARAEMILRWLLETSSKSSELRTNQRTWSLFSTCIRILPRRRGAALLAQYGFIGVLKSTCVEKNVSSETISAVASVFNLLLTLGDSEDGAAIKALLSTNAQDAASICGSWSHHVSTVLAERGVEVVTNDNLLNPGVRIWSLHIHSESDGLYFRAECLKPVIVLLVGLHNSSAGQNGKRKRDDMSSSIANLIWSLESMIAKQFVLPARAWFQRESDGSTSMTEEYKPREAVLRDYFIPLHELFSGNCSTEAPDFAPALLDIAIRATVLTTPKHRQREQPWIQAFFTALHGCFDLASPSQGNKAIVGMLKVLYGSRLSLSHWVISSIVRQNALCERAKIVSSDWQLIAKVCALDPHPLTDQNTTKTIFDGISRGLRDVDSSVSLADHRRSSDIAHAQESVISIVKAYGQSRKLSIFVEIWLSQLRTTYEKLDAVFWSDMAADIAVAMSASLAHQDLLSMLEIYLTQVRVQAGHLEQETSAKGGVFSLMVVLDTLLRCVHDESVMEKLVEPIRSLYDMLLYIPCQDEIMVSNDLSAAFLTLLDTVVRLRFPQWIANTSDRAVMGEIASNLLASKAYEMVRRSTSQATSTHLSLAEHVAIAKGRIVTRLFEIFHPYRDLKACDSLCRGTIKELDWSQSLVIDLLVAHPILSLEIGPKEATNATQLLLRNAIASTLQATVHDLSNLRAAIETFSSQSHSSALGAISEVLVNHYMSMAHEPIDAASQCTTLSLLDAIPLSLLSKDQRTGMLEALASLPKSETSTEICTLHQLRLAILTKLAKIGCFNVRLIADAKFFWNIVLGLRDEQRQDNSNEQTHESANLDLLESVASLTYAVFDSMLRDSSVEEAGREQSEIIRRLMMETSTNFRPQHHVDARLVTAIRVAVEVIDQTRNKTLIANFKHQDANVADPYFSNLVKVIEDASESSQKRANTVSSWAETIAALQSAVSNVDRATDRFPHDRSSLIKAVTRAAARLLEFRGGVIPGRVLAICYNVISVHAPGDPESFVPMSAKLLERDLDVRTHDAIVASFELMLQQSNRDGRRRALSALSNAEQLAPTSATLRLQRAIILHADKEDLITEDCRGAHDVLRVTITKLSNDALDLRSARVICHSLSLFLKDRPYLITQSTIEEVLAALDRLVNNHALGVPLYLDISRVLSTLLAHHRPRLNGRFHLMVALLQRMLTFVASEQQKSREKLLLRQAQAFARLLELFCDPPLVRHRSKPSSLVDERRKERAQVGQYMSGVLHHYCNQVLVTSMAQEIREILTPGIWSVIEAIEVHNSSGIEILSAAMSNSERAVLRSVYEEWKRSGKWEGT